MNKRNTAAVVEEFGRGNALGKRKKGKIGTLTLVLKEAFPAYGIPKRLYIDNGPSFSCDLLARGCALAGIRRIHSKPYDSPSRGKVERLFRSVRERFLRGLTGAGERKDTMALIHKNLTTSIPGVIKSLNLLLSGGTAQKGNQESDEIIRRKIPI